MNANQNRNWPVSPRHQPAQQAYPHAHAARVVKDDTDNEIWHVQVAAGDVRVVDLDKLDDLFRFEVIDENAFVWQKGMEKWARLGDLLGIADEEPDQPFHVLFSPGNVRVLTLDELNDFYQHEIIDESTLIWQKGMSEWQTLGKAAGIDEAVLPLRDAASSSAPTQVWATSAGVPPKAGTARPAPGAAMAPASSVRSTTAGPMSAQATAPARTVAPPAPSGRNTAAVPMVAQGTAYPPAVSPIPTALPNAMPAQAVTRPSPAIQVVPSAPFSTRPVSLSIEPYPLKPAPKASRWLIRVAVAAGVILAMLRNDMVHAALGKSPILAQYEQAERSLFGGPAFGTTRSVEQLVASCGGHLEPLHLPIAVTQFADAQKRGSVKDEKRAAGDTSTTKETSTKETSAPPPTVRSASSNTASATSSSASSGPAAAVKSASDTSRAVSSALSGIQPRPVSRPSKPRPSSSKPASKSGMKSSGSYYDPLNGAL